MENRKTMFAPDERKSIEQVTTDYRKFVSVDPFHQVTNSLPSIVMILNNERQIVYFNHILMKNLQINSEMNIIGKRPGELLNCIHADNEFSGCGTSEFCRECGAVNAILQSQNLGIITCFECRITTKDNTALDFRVWASPYLFNGKKYTIFSVIDISNEKRKEILERTFFHDINNLLMILIGYSSMLKLSNNENVKNEYIDSICSVGVQLSEEITSQQKLLQAENGSLNISTASLNSIEILRELSDFYDNSNLYVNRKVNIEEAAQNFIFTTDKALLVRILANMIKNALEASCENQNVTINVVKKGENAEFSVSNTGCMPRSSQLQMFQRSFSTKGKGRGIGTYSMKLFGEKYLKGKVWFKSDKISGTTFFLSIPVNFSSKKTVL